jgi:CheY-like chemotaxis protein
MEKQLNILVVEDDDISAMYYETILLSECDKLITVKSGADALVALDKNPDINIVLLDIKMNGMNGYETIEEIRKVNKDLFIIAQTAYASKRDELKCFKSGFDAYLSKPVRKGDLIDLIKRNV